MKWLFILLVQSLVLATQAGEVLVPLLVDPQSSSLQLTLDVLNNPGSDTQPLGGSMILAVDCFAPLASASLRDFHFQAVTNYQFVLFFGLFTAGATDLEIYHAAPGFEQPYIPVNSFGGVIFTEVPHRLRGTGAYSAEDPFCMSLQSIGLPCADIVNLADRMTTPIGEFPGILSLSNGVLRFTGNFRFGPVAVAAGSTLSGYGMVNASGVVQPCLRIQPGDPRGESRASWSSAFNGFRLYHTVSLTPPAQWDLVDDFFINDDGTTKTAYLVNEGNSAFYRLSNESP